MNAPSAREDAPPPAAGSGAPAMNFAHINLVHTPVSGHPRAGRHGSDRTTPLQDDFEAFNHHILKKIAEKQILFTMSPYARDK
jgi:hypothetical protein